MRSVKKPWPSYIYDLHIFWTLLSATFCINRITEFFTLEHMQSLMVKVRVRIRGLASLNSEIWIYKLWKWKIDCWLTCTIQSSPFYRDQSLFIAIGWHNLYILQFESDDSHYFKFSKREFYTEEGWTLFCNSAKNVGIRWVPVSLTVQFNTDNTQRSACRLKEFEQKQELDQKFAAFHWS